MTGIAYGGKPIYGASIGILMLEAQFPRIKGDMGNAATWPFPVHYKIVRGATPGRVVRQAADGLVGAFIDAARELQRDGVDAITTNCGFLALHQAEIAAAVTVPFASSSLMQIPFVEQTLPAGKKAGILTISAESLTADHLLAVGVDPATPLMGVDPSGEFARTILNDRSKMDIAQARAENTAAARSLAANADLGAIVLECTNMVPYARDIANATNLPVYSIYNLVCWLWQAVHPRAWQEAAGRPEF